MKAVPDFERSATGFEFARRHRFERHEQVVESSRTRQPGIERRVEYRLRLGKLLFRVFDGETLQEALRTDAGPAREESL